MSPSKPYMEHGFCWKRYSKGPKGKTFHFQNFLIPNPERQLSGISTGQGPLPGCTFLVIPKALRECFLLQKQGWSEQHRWDLLESTRNCSTSPNVAGSRSFVTKHSLHNSSLIIGNLFSPTLWVSYSHSANPFSARAGVQGEIQGQPGAHGWIQHRTA